MIWIFLTFVAFLVFAAFMVMFFGPKPNCSMVTGVIFASHKFGQWTITERGEVKSEPSKTVHGSYIQQERTCSTCGFTELEITKELL